MVAANHGQLDGKTTVQKLVYFSEWLNIPLKESPTFLPHFFGPYSAEVDFQLDKLAAYGFLEATTRATINDRLMYSYQLTPQGKQVLHSIQKQFPKELDAVKTLIETAKEASGLNPSTLSYAAKVHHILSKLNRPATIEELRKRARDKGWRVDEKDIVKGAKLLSVLSKIAKTRK